MVAPVDVLIDSRSPDAVRLRSDPFGAGHQVELLLRSVRADLMKRSGNEVYGSELLRIG